MYWLLPQELNLINNVKNPLNENYMVTGSQYLHSGGGVSAGGRGGGCMNKWSLEPVRLKGLELRTLYFLLQALVKQRYGCCLWMNLTLRH